MLTRERMPHVLAAAFTVSSLMAVSSASAQAVSNTWNTDAAGNWTDPLNWLGDTAYAEGADNTATFGNFISADRIVSLNAPITIGNVTASDTTHNYTISGANTLTLDRTTGTPTIDVITSRTLTIASDIAGSDGLNKTGAGTFILSGTNNTYSGTTTLTAGTLQGRVIGTSLNPVSPFGSSSILLNGGTLQLMASGSINATAETVNFGNNVTVGADATINVSRPGTTESNKTMGLGTLTIGANTLNATAPNISYSTGFSAVAMTGNATFSPGQYATLVLGNITQSGGNRSLTKTGVGTLSLTGTNDYAGGTILNGGTLRVSSNAALGDVSTGITVSGNTTLSSAATVSTEYNRVISIGAGTTLTLTHGGANTASFSGPITGSGNLTAALGASSSTIALTNTGNTFTGDVLVTNPNNGNLKLSFNSIGDAGMISLGKNSYTVYAQYTGSSDLVLNTRRIDLNSSFGSVNDGGGNPINMFESIGAGTITFNADMTVAAGKTGTFFFGGTNTGDNTYAGTIPNSSGGTLSIGKHGAGKWILSDDNTFAGGVEVRGGTLVLSGTNSYTGQTDIKGGTLVISSITNYGTDSAIGKGTAGTAISFTNGTLVYTGAGNSTNRLIQVGGGNGTILNNGAGALNFTETGTFNVQGSTTSARTLTFGGTNGGTISGAIQNNTGTAPALTLAKTGSGTWTLNGDSTYTGNTTVSGGTLKITGGGSIYGNAWNNTAVVTVQSGGVLELDNWLYQSNEGLGQLDKGAGRIVINGGTIRMNGTTSYGRGVTVQSGGATFEAASGANWTQGGPYDFTANTYTGNPSLTFTGAGNGTFEKIFSGTGSLTKSGAGTWTLTGTNTYTGVTTIAGGALSVGTIGNGGVAGNLGQATNAATNIVFDGGTLQYTGANSTSNRAFTINGGKIGTINTTNNLSLVGATGTATNGALTKTGAGTLTLTGTSTFTGGTTISAGALALGNATNTLADSGAISVDGGELSIGGNSDTVGAVTLISGSITGTGGTLTGSSYAVQSGSVSAILGGSGALAKSTAGTVTLTGANTYTGATTVSDGTLLVNNTTGSGTGTGAVTVSGTGAIGGTGTIGGSLNIAAGSLYVANLSDPLDVSGTTSIYSGFGVDDLAGITWGNVADGTYTLINGTLGAGVFASLNNNSAGTAYNLGGGRTAYFVQGSLDLVVSTVPEPTTLGLLAMGAVGLFRRRRVA